MALAVQEPFRAADEREEEREEEMSDDEDFAFPPVALDPFACGCGTPSCCECERNRRYEEEVVDDYLRMCGLTDPALKNDAVVRNLFFLHHHETREDRCVFAVWEELD